MAKRNRWQPRAKMRFVPVRDSEFAQTLAEIGELIYKELCSGQLHNQLDPSTVSVVNRQIASPASTEVANEQ